MQAQIPSALCAIHNFILIHDPPTDDKFPHDENSTNPIISIPNPGDNEVQHVDENVSSDVAVRRDKIAEDMWASYQSILELRRENGNANEGEDGDDDDDSHSDDENSELEEYTIE